MIIRRLNPEATHFLNVDLDIYSRQDLGALVNALGKRVIVLDVGRIKRIHHAHLELAKTTKTADATIRAFCALIETLPKAKRDLWNGANCRWCGNHGGGWNSSGACVLGARDSRARYCRAPAMVNPWS